MEKVANTQNVKPQAQTAAAQKNEHAANKDAEFKAKKAAAAKAFAERQKEKKAAIVENAKKLIDLDAKGTIKLPEDLKKFYSEIANPVVRTAGGSTSSFINKVFGDEPKVGQSITLLDYMKKTLKSKADLDKAVKLWNEKGIVVEFKAAANQLESTYTIKALPKAE
jgi:hypothetical protein